MTVKDHSLESGIYNLLEDVSSKDQKVGGSVHSTLSLRCSRYGKSGRRGLLKQWRIEHSQILIFMG